MKEVAYNTIYACDLLALADLCEVADLPARATQYRNAGQRVEQAILQQMYDEETAAFYDLNGPTSAQLKVLTAMSFFPLLLPHIPEEITHQVVRRHLDNPDEFSCAYPIPSVAMNDPSFYPKETLALWRGPTWPVINWFLFKSGKCEGRKAFHEKVPEHVLLAKRLRRASPLNGNRLSLRAISAKMAAAGFLNEKGKPYHPKSVLAMIDGPRPKGAS